MSGEVFTLALVDGEWRLPGVVSPAELEELERDHEAGDIRAEDRLRLLRGGARPCTNSGATWASSPSPASGTWSNRMEPVPLHGDGRWR